MIKRKSFPKKTWATAFALRVQRGIHTLVHRLNRKAARVSPLGLKVGLIIFCTVCTLASAFFALRGMAEPVFTVTPIRVIQVRPPSLQKESLPPGTLQRIEAAQRYLDSLRKTPGGRQHHDSLLARYPYLGDSLQGVLTLFHQKQ
jgi:hypothetical protein